MSELSLWLFKTKNTAIHDILEKVIQSGLIKIPNGSTDTPDLYKSKYCNCDTSDQHYN